jgi:tetratricopeptide (TPR) repeat protein
MYRRSVLAAVLVFVPLLLSGQKSSGPTELGPALLLFKQEQYAEAAEGLEAVASDPRTAGASRAEAEFWLAQCHLMLGRYEEAQATLEKLLAGYPSSPLRVEAWYHHSRLYFLQGEPERAIQELERFIAQNPTSEFVSSAYFWIGESLYSLGRLDEAARIFNKVVQQYGRSVKYEASKYRLSLIELKKQADELARLLRWSHEEALKATEEYDRREKMYEQAMAMYQRRLPPSGQAAPEVEAQGAGGEAAALREENRLLRERVATLEAQVSGLPQGAAASTPAEREELLRMKEEALAVKEQLLLQLAEAVGAEP